MKDILIRENSPLVQIVVPVYNAKNTLARCIESIKNQTYKNIEIILVNDGSTDISLEVCQIYSRVDNRIKVINNENQGVQASRNCGISYQHGKYIQFVDSDDTIQPYATEKLVEAAENNQQDLVIQHYNRISKPALEIDMQRSSDKQSDEKNYISSLPKIQTFGFLMEGSLSKSDFVDGLLQQPASFYYGVMWNKLYRSDIIKNNTDIVCAETMSWSEDLYFNLNYIKHANSFYAVQMPLYNYYNNPGSLIHTTTLNPVNVATTRATILKSFIDICTDTGIYEKDKQIIYRYLFGTCES